MRTRGITTLFGLSVLLWAPAPLFAQTTVAEFEAFIAEFQGDVEAYHATEFPSEADQDRAKDRLKRKLKEVLYAAEAEFQRTSQFDKGFSGIWTVNGTVSGGGEINDAEGQLKIERQAEPATLVTGEIKTPPAGSHLDFGFGDGEVYRVEFDGSESTVRKVSNRLRYWMQHGKSTINRDQTLTLETLAVGPDAELILLPSSSQAALEALGLTPSSAVGHTGYELDGKVTGGGGSVFEAVGRYDPADASVRGNAEASLIDGLGTFEMTLEADGSARLLVKGEAGATATTKLTRALKAIDDAKLAELLYQLNRLNLFLRYPRQDPVSYRANSRAVMARFAPNPELDPSGVEAWVVSLIDNATTSIDMAVFEFQLMRVAEALIRAQQRGVNVRVVHDADDNHEPPAVHLRRHQVEGDDDTAMLQVRDDKGRTSLMHNKFIVLDGETVWTGSTNLTPNGMYAQDNNALLFRNKTLAELYKTEFEEMFIQGNFGATDRAAAANTRWSFWKDTPSHKKGGRDDWLEIDDLTSVQVYFAPEDNAMDRLLELVKGAKKSIHFMAFSYASDTLAQAMKERMADGVEVRGLFEGMGTIDIAGDLYRAGADIRVKAIGSMKLHHKVMVIDGKIVCSGSFNFSDSADAKNDENMVVMQSEPLAGKFLQEFEAIYAISRPDDERVVGAGSPGQSGAGAASVIEGSLGD